MKLERSLQRWAALSPEAAKHLSEGAVFWLAADAQKDIAALAAEVAKLREALDECEEYFDNRADADCDQDGYIPNEEMKLLNVVRTALAGGSHA